MNAAEARAVYERSRAGRPEEMYRHAVRRIKAEARNGHCNMHCDSKYQQYVIDKLAADGFDVVRTSASNLKIAWVFDTLATPEVPK